MPSTSPASSPCVRCTSASSCPRRAAATIGARHDRARHGNVARHDGAGLEHGEHRRADHGRRRPTTGRRQPACGEHRRRLRRPTPPATADDERDDDADDRARLDAGVDRAGRHDGHAPRRLRDAGDGRSCARSRASSAAVGPAGGAGDEVFDRDSAEVQLDQGRGWTVVVGLSSSGENDLERPRPAVLRRRPAADVPVGPAGHRARRRDPVGADGATSRSSAAASRSPAASPRARPRSLSRVLNRGAFPTQVEVRRVDTVSPTLGEDSLRASIFAGLAGVAVLVLVLLLFYRRLTVLIAAGMIVWGMLIYSISRVHLADDQLRPDAWPASPASWCRSA